MMKGWSLTTGEQYASVFRRGRAYYGTIVAVRVLPNELDRSRLGLVVGKKVGGAVQRNRAKRRIRQIVSIRALTPGWDIVVIARAGIQRAEYRDLERELQLLLRKAGVAGTPGGAGDCRDTVLPEDHL